MKAAEFGRIINIVSTSVKIPLKNLGVSNTIRGAVASWAKTMSLELGPFNITVNNVLPGATTTARLEGIVKNASKNKNITEEEVAEEMTRGSADAQIWQSFGSGCCSGFPGISRCQLCNRHQHPGRRRKNRIHLI